MPGEDEDTVVPSNTLLREDGRELDGNEGFEPSDVQSNRGSTQ